MIFENIFENAQNIFENALVVKEQKLNCLKKHGLVRRNVVLIYKIYI